RCAPRAGDQSRRAHALCTQSRGLRAAVGGAHRGHGAPRARPRGRAGSAGSAGRALRSHMPPDVLMPKLSDTMEEGKIIRWLKQRGDRVAIGDILAEVETDKANMELEAFDEGVLSEIRTPEGESAPVGAVIAVLGDAADAKAAAAGPKDAARSKDAAKRPQPAAQ